MTKESDSSGKDLRKEADLRLAEALERSGLPDPRHRYRQWLRELRDRDEGAFRKALEYYEQHLVPAVASDGSDALGAWTEYGMRLAQRLRPGSAVRIDATGRSRPADASAPVDELILHLPTSARETALAVRLPARLSAAQEATLGLLVEGAG